MENNIILCGGTYYKLFEFFNREHGLILLESEIQEIIYEVNKFNKQQEAQVSDTNFKI